MAGQRRRRYQRRTVGQECEPIVSKCLQRGLVMGGKISEFGHQHATYFSSDILSGNGSCWILAAMIRSRFARGKKPQSRSGYDANHTSFVRRRCAAATSRRLVLCTSSLQACLNRLITDQVRTDFRIPPNDLLDERTRGRTTSSWPSTSSASSFLHSGAHHGAYVRMSHRDLSTSRTTNGR